MKKVLFFALILFWSVQASAFIDLKLELFDSSSVILRLKVVNTFPQSKGAQLEVVDVVSGQFAGKTVNMTLSEPAGLFEKIGEGAPAVFFIQQRGGVDFIHIGDEWVMAKLNPDKTAWNIKGEAENLNPKFPADTRTLERFIVHHQAGEKPLLEELHENLIFTGKPKPIKAFEEKPVAKQSVELEGESFVIGPWGQMLKADAKTGEGDKMLEAASERKGAAARFLEDDKQGLIVADKNDLKLGEMKEWKNALNFSRMTGKKWSNVVGDKVDFTHAALIPLDANGDKRPDLLILWKDGGVLLVNRGYNCFFVSTTSVNNLIESIKSTGLDLENCRLIATEDGLAATGNIGGKPATFLMGNLSEEEE